MAGTSGTPFSSSNGGILPSRGSREYWDAVGKDLRKQANALKKQNKVGGDLKQAEKEIGKLSKGQRVNLSREGKKP